MPRPFSVFFVVGEESGDQLGGRLIPALRRRLGADFQPLGLGGESMARAGLRPLYPIADTAIVGVGGILRNLPRLLARVRDCAAAAIAARPDVVVLIDSPEFTHAVARRIRRRAPSIPIVDYVSPSVWAWRPGRARRMRAYVDHVLALLPFEPEAHRRLGGPPCTYVGHPLIERLEALRPAPGERAAPGEGPAVLLVLPGSRRSEVSHLMQPFGAAVAEVARDAGPLEVLLPAVDGLADDIAQRAAGWPVQPTLIRGEAAKLAAFRRAHAALAASGTVTLELALAGVPMAVAYRSELPLAIMKRFVGVSTIVLPNLILGEHPIREYLNRELTGPVLAGAVLPLLAETPARRSQLAAFSRLDQRMALDRGTPSDMAAAIVADLAEKGRMPPATTG